MREFYIDNAAKAAVMKRMQRSTLRWKVGHVIAGVAFLILIGIIILIIQHKDDIGDDVFPVVVFASILPCLMIIFSLVIGRSAGVDITSGRLGERIYLNESSIVDSYTPRFTEVDSSSLVEDQIEYIDMAEIIHERKNCRYVISGLILTTKHDQFGRGISQQEKHQGRLIIYEYYLNMSEMVSEITQNSGLEIKEVD